MSDPIDINQGQRKELLALIRRYLPNTEVWAFGSRVKWTARSNSDLDLVAFAKQEDEGRVSQLKEALEESSLPFRVDLLVWENIPDSFKKNIRECCTVLVKPERSDHDRDLRVSWRTMPLEDWMAAIIDYRGKTPEKTTSGIPLITAKIVKGGRIEDPEEFIAEGSYEQWMRRGMPEAGDVVLTTEAPLGEVAQLDGSKVALAQRIIALRGKSGLLDNTYLKFALQSQPIQEQLHGRASGSTVTGIKQSELRKLQLTFPPLEEQRRVAAILGSLDAKIDLNRRINQTLEAMAQAIFKSWFVDFDPVKAKIAAKAEGRDPLRAAMSAISGKPDAELDALPPEQYNQLAATAVLFPDEMVESELGEIPRGWSAGTFKECCLRVESGGTPSRKEPSFWDGSIPWLTSGEVRDVIVLNTKERITREGLASSSAKLWPPMTTVVAMYGATAGQVCLIAEEMTANQACCALIPKPEFSTFVFIAARQSIQELAEKASGSAQQNLNKSLVEYHAQVIPCREIAERFEQATTTILQQWILNQRQDLTLSEIRDTLLPKLLSGELSVAECAVP